MTEWRPSDRFLITPQAMSKFFDDRAVLLHMTTKQMHILNETGSRLWRLILAGNTRAEMQRAMLQEFAVAESKLSEEIDTILARLSEEDFIRPEK